MSPFEFSELDLDGLKLPDVTDIHIPEVDFSEMIAELDALKIKPIDCDFPETDFDSLEMDPDIMRMCQESEEELQALIAEDETESPAPIVTEVRANSRKAERHSNERKRKKQGRSKAPN